MAPRPAHRWIATRPGGLDVFRLVEYVVPEPKHGEVTIAVRAAGMNPADTKHVAAARDAADFPRGVGYEVAGVLTALGPDTEIASGGGAVGDAVVAFRVRGGWATELTVPARDVYAKPARMPFEQAANLLLAGTTASEMLHRTGVSDGETILVHGASGAVGVMVLQQAALLGARVIGTASEPRFDVVRRYGGTPVGYGEGLEQRVREAAPEGVAASIDCIGTDEATQVSLDLVPDRRRLVTAGLPEQRAAEAGIRRVAGNLPDSAAYRDSVRGRLIELVDEGRLEVPMAGTYPLRDALVAAEVLRGRHPGGKLALLPDQNN